ncbi:unnamed protein product, partial [Ectocarpus fasciculatus]
SAQRFPAEISDQSFWKKLAPDMHIYDADFSNSIQFVQINNATGSYFQDLMIREGYIQIDPIAFTTPIEKMVQTIEKLHENKLPLAFSYVYDEFWLIFVSMHQVIEAMVGPGYKRLPDFWTWRIDPIAEERGWGLHRDKNGRTIGEDGLPNSLTVWIPLTDATTLNGCMYILPADRDPSYAAIGTGPEEDTVPQAPLIELVDEFRALPIDAGGVLMWNQQVYHYGSHASRRAAAPRYSLAMEFQSTDIPPMNLPLYDPLSLPSFQERLKLIAKQIIQYKHMYALDEETFEFAEAILQASEQEEITVPAS